MSVPVDGLMETFKYFPLVVGSSVSTTIIYHRRKTFQVIGIRIEEGDGGEKDITRRDTESLTMEKRRRVEADKENMRGKLGENICETDPQNADQSERSKASTYRSQCSDYGLLRCNAV